MVLWVGLVAVCVSVFLSLSVSVCLCLSVSLSMPVSFTRLGYLFRSLRRCIYVVSLASVCLSLDVCLSVCLFEHIPHYPQFPQLCHSFIHSGPDLYSAHNSEVAGTSLFTGATTKTKSIDSGSRS